MVAVVKWLYRQQRVCYLSILGVGTDHYRRQGIIGVQGKSLAERRILRPFCKKSQSCRLRYI